METKYNYARVGAFVLLLSLTLISMIIWLTVGTRNVNFTRYKIITGESVSGLSLNSSVSYRGVDVGRTVDLRLNLEDPRFVIITVDIEEDIPIKEDTTAVLASRGITGLVSIELQGGTPGSKMLTPAEGEKYAVITNGPSLVQRLDNAFTQIASQLSELSESTSSFLSKENAAHVKSILNNTDKLTGELAASANDLKSTMADISNLIHDVQPQLSSILNSADKSLSGDNGVFVRLKASLAKIESTFDNYDRLASDLTQTSQSWNQFANSNDKRLREVIPNINNFIIEVESLVNSIQRIIDDTSRNPNMFIFGRPSARKGPGE